MLYLLWNCVAAHMCAVLWNAVLYTVLYSTQPLQPLQLLATGEGRQKSATKSSSVLSGIASGHTASLQKVVVQHAVVPPKEDPYCVT